MKKTIIAIITTLVVLAAAFVAYINQSSQEVNPNDIPPITTIITDPYDGTYTINEEEIVLVNKVSHTQIPGASATTTTTYFGNDATGDIDRDGSQDTVFLLTQTNGGSGTFYYLVAKLNKKEGVFGTYGYLVGDRIAPQSISVDTDGIVTVNYADRKPGEPFTTQPSIGKSISLKLNVNIGQFEVVTSPIVKAPTTPISDKLASKIWSWTGTTHGNGEATTPNRPDRFKLTFKGNTFSASTDCNGVGGEYTVNGNKITFDKMMSTLMYCEGSQEGKFSQSLAEVTMFSFDQEGNLNLKTKDGVMVFK